VFPFIEVYDKLTKELTEFQYVDPSPPEIRTKEEGIKAFVGVRA
jgi:hypothetical protein